MRHQQKLFSVLLGLLFILTACEYPPQPVGSPTTFESTLSGGSVLPVPVQTNAGGTATIELDRNLKSLKYEIKLYNVSGYLTSMICCGAVHENGKPSISLDNTTTFNKDPRGKSLDITLKGVVEECFFDGELTGKTLEDFAMMVESGQMYVNIITTKYPDGELRGQLR